MSENTSPNTSPIDQGKSPVSGNGRALSAWTKAGFVGFLGVVALGWILFDSMHHKDPEQKNQPKVYGSGGEQMVVPPNASKSTTNQLPQPAQDKGPLSARIWGDQQRDSPATAPIMAFSGASLSMPSATPVQPSTSDLTEAQATAAATAGNPVPTASDKSPLGQKLETTTLEAEKASVLQHPEMVITEGRVIPCILETAISSELPGLVTCNVPSDIRGSTGDVVLLDRGTKIVGQLQNGLLQGQNRVFVVWTRAETPDHVIIKLDSPAVDDLGESGIPGHVDNHFWDRFGGALMLTLVQGGLEAATVEAGGNGGSNSTSQQASMGFLYSAQSNGQSVANTALQNSINIPPTLTKNQGGTVALILAHDLDFSDVYKLQPKSGDNGG